MIRWWTRLPVLACVAALAIGLIGVSVATLQGQVSDLDVERVHIGRTPATVFAPREATGRPAIVIAHGFAGSRQLMQPFAISLARAGYTAISFDFPGHGRNPEPMRGDVTAEDGATRYLLASLDEVVAYARTRTNSRKVALLGHSMASDIIVRHAIADPEVMATVAVSMFSPAVTPEQPRNLLVIVGGWEPPMLKDEALRVVGQITDQPPEFGTTYNTPGPGTGRDMSRRAVIAPSVEHIGVLYQTDGIAEAITWIDSSFDANESRPLDSFVVARGPWILLLIAGCVLLAWPASRLLPQLVTHGDRAAETAAFPPWRTTLIVTLGAGLLTPLILWPLPTDFLPVLVGGYLVCHFGLYGALTWLGLRLLDRRAGGTAVRERPPPLKTALATLAATLFVMLAIGWPIETYVASFVPIPERMPLLAVMLIGTVPFFLTQARMASADWARGLVGKTGFILSLALAIALDLYGLFFLIILMPVIVLFFVIFGFFARLITARTGTPVVAALANALALAWAIAVTFPMLASGP
jgi:pimeloyl-ACP methyl ester carboxylesterase